MENLISRKGIGTMISNLVARTVMIPYNGTQYKSPTYVLSICMGLWIGMVNGYPNWSYGWVVTALIMATATLCVGGVVLYNIGILLILPTILTVAINTFYYEHKIDHRILYDLFPLLVYVTLRTKNLFWITISLCFFWGQSGFAKAWHGWLDTDTQAAYSHLLFYHLNGFSDRAGWFLSNLPTWLWEVMDWSVVVFELSFIVALWSRSLMKVLLPLAVIFHLGVWLMFDINYFFHLPVYLFLFLTIKK